MFINFSLLIPKSLTVLKPRAISYAGCIELITDKLVQYGSNSLTTSRIDANF